MILKFSEIYFLFGCSNKDGVRVYEIQKWGFMIFANTCGSFKACSQSNRSIKLKLIIWNDCKDKPKIMRTDRDVDLNCISTVKKSNDATRRLGFIKSLRKNSILSIIFTNKQICKTLLNLFKCIYLHTVFDNSFAPECFSQ